MQRFASSLIARPVFSSLSRSTFVRTMAVNASQIKEHSIVYDSEGKEFAKVDHMQGSDTIKLTRDSTGGESHHFIPLAWVNKVEGNVVRITKTADQARAEWKAESQ